MRCMNSLRIYDDVSSARTRGKGDRRRGYVLEANPFNSSTHPALFAAWARGWLAEDRFHPANAHRKSRARKAGAVGKAERAGL